MSFDNIDLDSWGKAAELEPTTEPVSQAADERRTRQPKRDRETHVSRSSQEKKILTGLVLGEAIKDSRLGTTGEKTVQYWLFKRNKSGKLDLSVTSYLVEIFRQLQKKGYE